MKTLIITRHGKAVESRYSYGDSDKLRKLTSRGINDIKIIASQLKKYSLIPELIISSPSTRTIETSYNLIDSIDNEIPVEIQDYLYMNLPVINPLKLLEFIEYRTEKTIMIVGHNPSLELLIKKLSGMSIDLPTSGTAVIDFNIDNWNKISKTKGTIVKLFIPKDLKQ